MLEQLFLFLTLFAAESLVYFFLLIILAKGRSSRPTPRGFFCIGCVCWLITRAVYKWF